MLGARRITGRRRKGKRLAIPAFKMASSAIADESLEDANFSRPFHYAFLEKKVICPDSECFKKLLFFEKIAGLGQHYRVIHKKTVTEVVMKKASETWNIFVF